MPIRTIASKEIEIQEGRVLEEHLQLTLKL
jgi:hypothetical protein